MDWWAIEGLIWAHNREHCVFHAFKKVLNDTIKNVRPLSPSLSVYLSLSFCLSPFLLLKCAGLQFILLNLSPWQKMHCLFFSVSDAADTLLMCLAAVLLTGGSLRFFLATPSDARRRLLSSDASDINALSSSSERLHRPRTLSGTVRDACCWIKSFTGIKRLFLAGKSKSEGVIVIIIFISRSSSSSSTIVIIIIIME